MALNVNGRLRKAEAFLAEEQEAQELPGWLEEALGRSQAAVETLRQVLSDRATFGRAAELVADNLRRLVGAAESGCTRQTWCVTWGLAWPETLAFFLQRLPSGLRGAVIAGLGRQEDGTSSQLDGWLVWLAGRQWRLPADINSRVLGDLVRIFLEERLTGFEDVCVHCGLSLPVRHTEDPYADGRFYKECPHCHGREFWPSGRVDEKAFPWKQLLAVELPGGEDSDEL
jgi:hypothetical protein